MNALGQSSPLDKRRYGAETIRDLSNRKVVASNVGLTIWTAWRWAADAISEHYECDPDAVHILETDDGDVIAVDGKPVAYFEGSYHA